MSRYPGWKGCARRPIRRASFSFPEAMELKEHSSFCPLAVIAREMGTSMLK